MTVDARETSVRVRDGLLLLEEQERGRPETLIEELEGEANASLRTIQNLIDAMARQRRLWLANGMNVLVADGNAVIPGTFTRARWLEIQEAFNAFEVWMTTPLETCQTPPLVVVSRRGNPPEPAQPPAETVRAEDVEDVEDVIVEGQTTKGARRAQ